MSKRGTARLANAFARQDRRAKAHLYENARATVADAERYRWLRDHSGNDIMRDLMKESRPDEWDKLVDADRATVGKGEGQ